MPQTFGERLAFVRGDVRQEDFAKRFKVSRKTLIRYESNERVPGSDFVAAVIAAFGLDANWLLLGVGELPEPELTPREAALLDNYRHCPEDAQRSIETTSALLAQRGGGTGVKKAG